ncbi:MAG: hypothetical protein WCL14_02080 [Bacteroidota bacterium]
MKKLFRSNLPSIIAPIVAAARCFVSAMRMQRLQRIAGLAMIREETIGSLLKMLKASGNWDGLFAEME